MNYSEDEKSLEIIEKELYINTIITYGSMNQPINTDNPRNIYTANHGFLIGKTREELLNATNKLKEEAEENELTLRQFYFSVGSTVKTVASYYKNAYIDLSKLITKFMGDMGLY